MTLTTTAIFISNLYDISISILGYITVTTATITESSAIYHSPSLPGSSKLFKALIKVSINTDYYRVLIDITINIVIIISLFDILIRIMRSPVGKKIADSGGITLNINNIDSINAISINTAKLRRIKQVWA